MVLSNTAIEESDGNENSGTNAKRTSALASVRVDLDVRVVFVAIARCTTLEVDAFHPT